MEKEKHLTLNDYELDREKAFGHLSLEERAKLYGGRLGPYEEYDWGEPVGREIW